MIFWSREILGWLLVATGLIIFLLCYFQLLLRGRIFEAGPAAFIGFVVFRSGVHLVKVAVAARLCTQALDHTLAPAHLLSVAQPARKRPTPRPRG